MSLTDKLLADIEAFLSRTKMRPSTFGQIACGDKHVVRRLRQGFSVGLPRADKLWDFMRAYEQGDGDQPPRSHKGRPRRTERIAA